MKTHKKIDIYVKRGNNNWYDYYASTNRCKTCKEAKLVFLEMYKCNPNQVKVFFSK